MKNYRLVVLVAFLLSSQLSMGAETTTATQYNAERVVLKVARAIGKQITPQSPLSPTAIKLTDTFSEYVRAKHPHLEDGVARHLSIPAAGPTELLIDKTSDDMEHLTHNMDCQHTINLRNAFLGYIASTST